MQRAIHPTAIHRLRPILAGIIVLVLTAGAAFAGQPTETPVDGRDVAGERSGMTVPPVAPGPALEDEDEPGDEDGEADSDEPDELDVDAELDEEINGDGEHCVDPATLTEEELAASNHGSIVCWAAHQETPDGYDNHGQWVSEWAKGGLGDALRAPRSAKARGKKP